jgi:hypothetical protein
MLTGMEIPVTAGPWLVLGLALGILAPVLAALAVVALRRRGPGTPPPAAPAVPPAGSGADDLPGFLESPPGSAPTPAVPAAGWPPLSSPANPPPMISAPEPALRRDGGGSTGVLVAMAVTALVLIGAVAAVAATRTSGRPDGGEGVSSRESSGSADDAGPGHVSAELTFEGVVLERHAVGVTVAYPRVSVTTDHGRSTAEIELATFNCLRDEAPEDPVAAGCTRSVPEHAELSAPELTVRADDAGVRLSGAFPTSRRPNGSPPVATGRVYQLTVSAGPRDGRADEAREPATGLLELGDERVGTSDEGPNEITVGG